MAGSIPRYQRSRSGRASRDSVVGTETRLWAPHMLLFSAYRGNASGREADHSTRSTAAVIMRGAILLLPLYTFMVWTRINFTFTCTSGYIYRKWDLKNLILKGASKNP
jgi:hypothetical protein